MSTKRPAKNAPLWIKLFVGFHLVCITMWSLPYPKKPYMNGTAKLGIQTNDARTFVRSFSETVTEGTATITGTALTETVTGTALADNGTDTVTFGTETVSGTALTDTVTRMSAVAAAEDPKAAEASEAARTLGAAMWKHPTAMYLVAPSANAAADTPPGFVLLCQAGADAEALTAKLNELRAKAPPHEQRKCAKVPPPRASTRNELDSFTPRSSPNGAA